MMLELSPKVKAAMYSIAALLLMLAGYSGHSLLCPACQCGCAACQCNKDDTGAQCCPCKNCSCDDCKCCDGCCK